MDSHHAPDPMTWAYLLARWTEFARASVAFPRDDTGQRWKATVPDIIALQAITHALAEARHLPAHEHALALERAELGIRTHAANIHQAWRAQPLPDSLTQLISDAPLAHRIAASLGVEYRVAIPRLIAPNLLPLADLLRQSGQPATLRLAAPGTILFENEPILFIAPGITLPTGFEQHLAVITGIERAPEPVMPTQIYRQTEPETNPSATPNASTVTADLIAPLHTELPPGRPLLLTVLEHGAPTHALEELRHHDAQRWLEQQRDAGLHEHTIIPVRTLAPNQ